MKKINFLLNFIKNPLVNASVIPSSKYLAKKMISGIDFSKIDSIIELGPGEGTFTREILKKAKPSAKIIIIELEETYIDTLKKDFGDRVIVVHDSAHRLEEIAKQHGVDKIDLILSGIPFTIPVHIKKAMFGSIIKLSKTGTIFRNFTYFPPVYKKVNNGYPLKKKKFTILNFPPAWVYGIN